MSALFVLWIFCAFACGWLAGQKGHSVPSWFLLGCLFGPLAVLVVGLSPKRDVSVRTEKEAVRDAYWERKAQVWRRKQDEKGKPAVERESTTTRSGVVFFWLVLAFAILVMIGLLAPA